jgi:hypothetical protein
MVKVGWAVLACGVGLISGTSAAAQTPAAYTATIENSMFPQPVTETVYRDGSRAVIDLNSPGATGATATHTRSLYDLGSHKNTSWDTVDSTSGCSTGGFSGDWGDPFAPMDDLKGAKQTGTETLNGFATKVMEEEVGGTKAKAWIDAKTGMMVKLQMTQGSDTKTMIEVKKLTVGAPAASAFTLPASCTAVVGPPPVSPHDQKIADETGSKVGDFIDAVMTTAPGSQETCSVAVRVMKAGTMTPITGGFKLSANVIDDAKWAQGDTSPGANVPVGMGANGVWRIATPPARFNLGEDFGNAGAGGGKIHRQCWGAVSTLLLIVQDPQNLGVGTDWVWDTKGKYAAGK